MKFCSKCKAETERQNTGKCKVCSVAYYAANKDAILAKQASYYAVNVEKCAAYNAAYRAANPEKHKARSAEWSAKNPEKARARIAAWRKENPDRKRTQNSNRRASQRNAIGKHTASEIKGLITLQKGLCICCRVNLKKDYHVDHIMPLAKGGGNDIHNLQLLCQPCNNRKHAKHPIEFMQQNGYLL